MTHHFTTFCANRLPKCYSMDKVVQILCAVLLATVVQARPENLLGATVLAAPAVVAAPAVATAAVVAAPVSSQYHAQDALGQYSYGYVGGPSSKAETKTADGVVRGGYSYLDANGVVQTINYIADDYGFRVAASNLPVHVPADTPEVAAAKAAHAAAYTQAAVAAAAAPDVPQPEGAAVVAAAPAVVHAAPAAVPLTVTAPVAHTVITPGVVSTTSTTGFAYSSTAAAPYYAPYYHHYAYGIPLLVNGVPLDTPEVAAAKAAHYAAHVAAKYHHYLYL